ncbi:hypothetical protein PV05_06111 [Exophiala xenobiotica]|uniref:Uncharacterized protein n=1 Tax=Exophiala xenobiotica TaxID=348802 RepID=A0A0D2ES62_9EURO|nr:uncharacterized protein PV05_06111 [Exophiala xenobiotica]KIW57570.1 hypothetical protein PV05_06111 [Exophiala xenobiotica]
MPYQLCKAQERSWQPLRRRLYKSGRKVDNEQVTVRWFRSGSGPQGVNVMIRKATSVASMHLKIKQPSENDLQMEQTATAASIPGTTEKYILDWKRRNSHDAFFGDIEGRSRWIS